jgi:Tfp pilus assembly protein PilF
MQTKKIITLLLLLSCFVCFIGCSHNPKKAEERKLSEEFYQNLLMAFNARDYQLVKTGLDEINKAGIADKRTLYLEALIDIIQNMPDKAITNLQAAIAMDPGFSEAHNTLGTVYMQQQKFSLAQTEFLRACDNPLYLTPEKSYHNLGNLYTRQEKLEQAQGCYLKAIELNHDYFPSHYELSRLYLNSNRLDLAAREIEKAKKIAPEHPGVWLQIGDIEATRGEIDLAVAAYKKVIKLNPGSNFADRASQELDRINKTY